jgi:hypothetical protein
VELPGVTFTGPAPDDPEVLGRLPEVLQGLLADSNGFIAYGGGLHVRGASFEPAWHSIRAAWWGDRAFHRVYGAVAESDVPFAEDAVGDQWLLRGDEVVQLSAETGDVDGLGLGLPEFLASATHDPMEALGLHPLMQFANEGGRLEPGQLLHVYPPFCTEEAAKGVSLDAVPAAERLYFLAELARQMPGGGEFRIEVQ